MAMALWLLRPLAMAAPGYGGPQSMHHHSDDVYMTSQLITCAQLCCSLRGVVAKF